MKRWETAVKPENEEILLEELIALPLQFWGLLGRSSNRIAFVSNKTGRLELHLLDLDKREFSQLTHGEYPVSPTGLHKWAPDDSYLLFPKDPVPGNEKNDIFRISVPNGEVTRLTDTPQSRDDVMEVSHDGKYIVFFSDRVNGIAQIFRMNPDGTNVTQLTDHSRPVSFWTEAVVSPDDEWIAYNANESEDLQNLDVWLVRMDGSEKKKVFGVRDGSKDLIFDWSKDGTMLLIGSDHSGIEQAGVYHLASGEVKWFGDARAPETPIQFTGDGKRIIVGRDIDAVQKLLLYDIETGEERILDIPSGFAGALRQPNKGHSLLLGHQDTTHRMRFLLYDLQKHNYEEVIPAEHGRYTPDDFHAGEYISYPSGDVKIHAILYRPKNTDPDEKLPAIVMPHGGPTGQYYRLFDEDAQLFASRGCVTLLPNVRGSTGYGVEFRDACLNDWGGKDLDDIEAGVTYLRSLNYVDSNRIGIHGGSYGGYMTFIAVTKKPDLWKAASAWMGISSLKRMYEKCKETFPALSFYLEEQMGKPEDEGVLELWEDRSAINFVENMTAKLQMIHAENDPRCPIEQSEMFRDRLLELGKKEGVDFEFIRLTKEGHGSFDTDQRVRLKRHVLDFFQRNL
ncbi:MAG: S9 family peptidase [Candidatus Thorarchaeota archaeon]|nr:S9 family peptidase [Candidatus Thorarchaeota archaeon]